jgi:hypothetical protein
VAHLPDNHHLADNSAHDHHNTIHAFAETPYAVYAGVISIVIIIVGLAAYLLVKR